MPDVLEHIRTPEELSNMRIVLEDLHAALFKTGEGSFSNLMASNTVSPEIQRVRAFLTSKNIDFANADLVTAALNELQDQLDTFDTIQVNLAFVPDSSFLDTLVKWFHENGFSHAILDIKTEPKLLGGVAVVHKGSYIDMSLAKLLRDYDFAQVFKEVITAHA